MSMNPTLARMYNTHGVAKVAQAQQQKVAHLMLFAKAASANNIDLGALSQQEREQLYHEFNMKLAEEGGEFPPKEDEEEDEEGKKKKDEEGGDGDGGGEEEEKKEAQAQFGRMREWQTKTAEADILGRQMAHAFWDETQQIQKAAEAQKNAAPLLGPKGNPGMTGGMSAGKKALLGAGVAAAGIGGAALAHRAMKDKGGDAPAEGGGETKAASAFDWQAARQAVKIAQQAGLPQNQVAERLQAILTLGVPAMDKTASALETYDGALNVRALELLEAAKYPVNWNHVLGA